MPDPDFKTISSSQAPALLNLSQWQTRLMLWRQFRDRIKDESGESLRMRIGKLFEPLILEKAAEALSLEVVPNAEQVFERHGTLPLGCTVDAEVFCPTRGPGIVEAKAIDVFSWRDGWSETHVPRMYRVQLQEQILVRGYTWGVIACLIYNEGADGRLIIYEFKVHEAAQNKIASEATLFFESIAQNKPPDAFGLPAEIDTLGHMYPEVNVERVIEAADNVAMAEMARMYAWARLQRSSFAKIERDLKPKLVRFMEDAAAAHLAGGVHIQMGKSPRAGQIVMLPADLRKRLESVAVNLPVDSPAREAVQEAMEWVKILKRPGISSRLKVFDPDADAPIDDTDTILGAG